MVKVNTVGENSPPFVYFVSYTFRENEGFAVGNIEVTSPVGFTSIEQLRKIEDDIKKALRDDGLDASHVIVTGFHYLRHDIVQPVAEPPMTLTPDQMP